MEPFKQAKRILPFSGAVGDLLKEPVLLIEESLSIRKAAASLAGSGGEHIVVCRDGIPAGIINHSNLIKYAISSENPEERFVREFMDPQIISVQKEMSAYEGLMYMIKHGVDHLLVMDGDKPMGVVSETDWISFDHHYPRDILEQIERSTTLEGIAGSREEANQEIWDNYVKEGNAVSLTGFVTLLNDSIGR
jgi:CBS domain-containing protein